MKKAQRIFWFSLLAGLVISLALAGCNFPSNRASGPSTGSGSGPSTGSGNETRPPTDGQEVSSGAVGPDSTRPASQASGSTPPAGSELPTPGLAGLPTLANLREGWNQIDPGGETSCARGGKYSFFVRKAKSDRLLVYFEGGGSCYDAKTCSPAGHYFDDSIDPNVQADNPALKTTGLFALDDARNPYQDDNIVFVSYCTGDGFMGNRAIPYQDGNDRFTINHFGFLNTRVVLAWVYQNFPSPARLSVVGCSAGVVGSYFHAPYILRQYPNTPYTQLGDSGGGFTDSPTAYVENFGTLELLPPWLPQYDQLRSGNRFHTTLLFTLPAQLYPKARFGLLDTVNDSAQSELVPRLSLNTTLEKLIKKNLAEIQTAAPNVKYYLATGDEHCITMLPQYYERSVNGVALSDWVRQFVEQKPVENVAP